jgi:hypothetical protein
LTEPFTREELEQIQRRATELAQAQDDAGVRTALQVLGEAAANLGAKLPSGDTG